VTECTLYSGDGELSARLRSAGHLHRTLVPEADSNRSECHAAVSLARQILTTSYFSAALARSDQPVLLRMTLRAVTAFCEWRYPGLKIPSEEARGEKGQGGVQLLLMSCFPLLFGGPLCNCKHYEAPAG
jgi:hypothetical protein